MSNKNTAEKTVDQTSQLSEYFSLDSFLMGGLSIIVCVLAWAFMDKAASLMTISSLAFGLAFLVNHPHFLSSYTLLYGDFRGMILKKKRYFWAAIVSPILIGAALVAAMTQQNATIMGHVITAMYFLVGWHYVKQIFGCVIVTSAQRKIYFTAGERKVLLTNLFAVWFMSWLGSHIGQHNFDFYGIQHHSLDLPAWTLQATYAVVGVTFVMNAWMVLRKYINEGKKPSPPGVVAYAALYAWYLPTFSHPGFAYLIPLFHSLQYLAFVWTLKKNQADYETHTLFGREQRKAWVKKFGGFLLTSFVLGALFFEFIPKGLDSASLVPQGAMGYAPFVAAFLLFINVHHYFNDNAIWRSDNEIVKKFLMQAGSKTEPAYTNKVSSKAA